MVELNAASRKVEGEFVEVIRRWIEKSRLPPFNSPPPPSPFIGYTRQLEDAVLAVLWSRNRVVCVGGPLGCGLTSFLRQACELARERVAFAGGIYMLDAQVVLAEDTLLADLCALIGLSVSGAVRDAVAKWTSRMSKPTLVLVDGGRAPLAKWLPLLESVASQSSNLHIILGSSSNAAEGAGWRVRLSGWSEDEMVTFVRSRPVGTSLPAEALASVHRLCDGLPQATHRLLMYDRELILNVINGAATITAATRMSHLSAESRALLTKLWVFPASFSIDAVMTVGGLAEKDVAAALLAKLVRWGFVQSTGRDRWFVDASVEEGDVFVARETPTLAAFVAFYVGIANRSNSLYASWAGMTGQALFDSELDNLDAVFELCKKGVDLPAKVQAALQDLQSDLRIVSMRLSLPDQLDVAEGMLAIRRSALGPRHPGVATSLSVVGYVLYAQGQAEEALAKLREALEINKATLGPDHPDSAATLRSIENIERKLRPPGTPQDYYD